MKIQKISLKQLYTFFIIFYPFLNIYKSPIKFINLSSFIILILIVFLIISKNFKSKIYKNDYVVFLFLLALFLFFLTILSILIFQRVNILSVVGRYFFLFFYIFLLRLTYDFFDVDLGIKVIRKLSVIACFTLIFQILFFYFFGILLKVYVPFLKLNPGLKGALELLYSNIKNVNKFRPYTLLGEPSHFAYYISISLAVLLFLDKNITSKKFKFVLGLYSVSLILSTSGTGIYLLVIIIIFYISNNFNKKNLKLLLNSIIIFSLMFIFYRSHIIYSFSRIIISSSRYLSFLVYFKELSPIHKLIGIGAGNSSIYFENSIKNLNSTFMSGVGRIFVESGFFGGVAFLLIFIYLLKKSTKQSRIFVIIFIFLNFIEVTFFNIYMVLLMVWPTLEHHKKLLLKNKFIERKWRR